MRLRIDTDNKTIKIEEKVNLDKLMEKLNKIFPEDTWKEYSPEVNQIVDLQNPIIIKQPCKPNYPWQNPIIYNNDSSGNFIQPQTIITYNV